MQKICFFHKLLRATGISRFGLLDPLLILVADINGSIALDAVNGHFVQYVHEVLVSGGIISFDDHHYIFRLTFGVPQLCHLIPFLMITSRIPSLLAKLVALKKFGSADAFGSWAKPA